jgi:integrase
MGKKEMQRQGMTIGDDEITTLIAELCPTRRSRGKTLDKTPAELRCEAKRKLTQKKVKGLAPRYSLHALRHSFATDALRKGIDSLTVAILLGHKDPSTLARVYQHLNQNPEHLLEQAKRAAA